MKANETQLRVLLEGQKLFRVPLFQRTYSWRKSNWETTWNDIIETYEGGPDSRHFMGSIVTKSLPSTPEGVAPYLVIDGQQRLTTLSVMLAALRDSAQAQNPRLAQKIETLYLRNGFVSGMDVYKILPTQADRKAYFQIIDQPALEEGRNPIRDAYLYFEKTIRKAQADDKSFDLNRLEQVIVSGIELVSITLDESDNEYRIFESLNAKGTPLTQADLIRNFFFMRISHTQQDAVYSGLWLPLQQALNDHLEDFFRHQLLSYGEFVRKSDVYQSWKTKLSNRNSDQLIEELRTLLHDSKLFLRLLYPEKEPNSSVAKGIYRLNRWGSETIYPYLLNIYRRYEEPKISAQDFAEILSMLESFLVRRFFVGVPTNQLNRLFLRLYDQIPSSLDLVNGTKAVLSEPSRRWPNDQEFESALQTFPLYINGRPDQRKMILESFELNFGHHEQPDLSTLTIEHILPQQLSPEWIRDLGGPAIVTTNENRLRSLLHTIGNLTLTGYNIELSNSSFSKKRELLEESNLQMNREIARNKEWGLEQIEERGKLLAKRALTIWIGPSKDRQPFIIPPITTLKDTLDVINEQYIPPEPPITKGYEKLTDYLIPVIRLIVSGVKHTDAFRQIAEELGVKYQTVNAECTRGLKISTEQFLELIKNNEIKSFLKERFPNKASLIEEDLSF